MAKEGVSPAKAPSVSTEAAGAASSEWVIPPDLEGCIESLPAVWRKRAGIDACLAALEQGEAPPPVEFDVMEVPVLSGLATVPPIASVEELIDAVAAAVESCDATLDYLRVLDGISRLWRHRSDNFERQATPLSRRIREVLEAQSSKFTLAHVSICTETGAHLLMRWIHGEKGGYLDDLWMLEEDSSESRPFVKSSWSKGRSMVDIWARMDEGVEVPLLCMPTHEGGWIEPVTFVKRLRQYEEAGISPVKNDLIQGLLRLAPDGRATALNACTGLKGSESRALRYALGARKPGMRSGDDPDIWLAACRARDPRGTVDLEIDGKLFGVGPDFAPYPDGIEGATYHWDLLPEDEEAITHVDKIPCMETSNMRVLTTPTTPEFVRSPAGLIVCVHQNTTGKAPGDGRSYLWPQNRERCHAYAAQQMAYWVDERSWYAREPCLGIDSAHEPDQPVTESLLLSLCIGMMCADVDARVAAGDALVTLIEDGRVTEANLGETLLWLADADWFQLKRLAESLGNLGSASPAHSCVVVRALQPVLARYERPPRDFGAGLLVVKELLESLGLTPIDALRERLESIKGGSNAAKLAKQLLAMEQGDGKATEEVWAAMLGARIARAERWAEANSE